MHIFLNDEKIAIFQNQTLSGLLKNLCLDEKTMGIAVALNNQIIFRSEWHEKLLAEGDCIDVIHAVQGG